MLHSQMMNYEQMMSENSETSIPLFLVSDLNPMFSMLGFENIIHYMKEINFKNIIFVPTGTLQVNTLKLDAEALDLKFDEAKIKTKCNATERATTNKIFQAINNNAHFEIIRVKPITQTQKTPPTIFAENMKTKTENKIEELFDQLENQLKKNSITYEKSENRIKLTKNLINSTNKKVVQLVAQIQELQTTLIYQKSIRLTPNTCSKKKFSELLSQPASIDNPTALILPFSAVTNDKEEMKEYAKLRSELQDFFKEDLFKEVVGQATKIRLENLYDKNPDSTLKKHEWVESKMKVARLQTKEYFEKEVPFFFMVMKSAIELFKKSGKKILFCYPMQGPLGTLIFEYSAKIFKEKLSDAFIFTDITSLLSNEYKPKEPFMLPPSALSVFSKSTN